MARAAHLSSVNVALWRMASHRAVTPSSSIQLRTSLVWDREAEGGEGAMTGGGGGGEGSTSTGIGTGMGMGKTTGTGSVVTLTYSRWASDAGRLLPARSRSAVV